MSEDTPEPVTFLKIGEMPGRRTCSISQNGVRHYTRTWLVVTDSMLTDSASVMDAAVDEEGDDTDPVPAMFDAYETDVGSDIQALVMSKSAREDAENPFRWEVDVEYSSDCTDPDFGTEDPLQRAPVYVWSHESEKVPAQKAVDGGDICNSAFMAFDPPPEIDKAIRVLTITRNEATFDPGADDIYSYTVNSAPIFGYEAGKARMEPIGAVQAYEAGNQYWKKTYVLKFRDYWSLKPLDQGPVELIDGEWVVITDQRAGSAIPGQTLLDGNGLRLDPTEDDPVYLEFDVYPPKDFNDLNLMGP